MTDARLAEPSSAPVFEDERGRLTLYEFKQFPFAPTRSYLLDEIPVGARRAGHASRSQHRLLVGVSGRARVTVDDGYRSRELQLGPSEMVHVPPRTWQEIEALEARTAILVFADGDYDPGDIVRERSALPLAQPSTARQTSDA